MLDPDKKTIMEKTKKSAPAKHSKTKKPTKTKRATEISLLDAAIIGSITPPFGSAARQPL